MRPLLLALVFASLPCLAAAQIESAGAPAAVTAALSPDAVPVEFVQPPDVAAYLAEDAARTAAGPLRYGALLDVSIEPTTHGVWDRLADGSLVWRVTLFSPGAKSLGLEFDDFRLPDGAFVHLYDERLERVHGAFGAQNNQPHDQLQLAPFPGDRVVLEYVQPAGVGGAPRLSLGTVIYDYRDLFALEAGLDAATGGEGGSGAGACLIDVNCPEGDPYPLQKRATVRTLSGGGLCSGALVNNTAQDETGYVLTAWHCGQSSNTVFRFNYQTSSCGSGGAPTGQNVSGCSVLASDNPSDGRLLRINTPIPASYSPYYAGWSRSTSFPTDCMSMHHPGGGVKKISLAPGGASKSITFVSGIGNVLAWTTNFTGGFQGGSSGGPLFNQNQHLIGNLSGGPQVSCPTQGIYGRFYDFWANDPIAQYLDPLDIGLLSLDGWDPENPGGGPGSTIPTIDSVTPATVAAVNADTPFTITLNGTGFEGLTSIEIDGVPLSGFPPQFNVVSNSTVKVLLLPPLSVGTIAIKVIKGHLEDTIDLPIDFNAAPTIDLVNSDPSFLLSALPLEIYMGGQPGDTAFLLASTTLLPSTVPGILDAAIGNGLADLYGLGAFVVDPVTGWAVAEIPFSGIAIGTRLYFQAGFLAAAGPSLPLAMSNVESGTVLF